MTESKPPSLIDDCFLHDKDRLRHDEALALLRERLRVVVGTETISTSNALGRILSQSITAPHAVPLHTNAAVDGYAFNHASFDGQALQVSNRIAAGDLAPPQIEDKTAVRIFTGAVMPEGADTVAMQEDCSEEAGLVSLPNGLKSGANCRKAGEDVAVGETILHQGPRLKAADLAALASIGVHEIKVYRLLKVALFSNGNEMRAPGENTAPLKPGEVYDANQPLIAALCERLPIELHSKGIIEDTADAARAAIKSAAQDYDVIITTGGASRGAEDHMLTTLDELGSRHLWQLAVKPGRPMMFGQIAKPVPQNDCLLFGLPGNPVAAMVCFLLYTRPALIRLCGGNWETPHRFKIPAAFSIKSKKPDRREFLRGILKTKRDGTLVADKFQRDGSGLISSLREADGLIEIEEQVTSLSEGDLVSFIPFSSIE